MAAAKDFMDRQVKADKPFFCWFNSTRMHVFTHLKPASDGKTGLGIQADGMVEHDGQVGELLKFLDDQKIADNTLVIYSTDNGAMKNQWPDGGASPFRSEKDTNWEGAVRVPCMVALAGRDQARHDHRRAVLGRGLAADAGRGGRRRRRPQGQAAQGLSGRRQDLQGPSRRLQPAAGAQGRGDQSRRARSTSTSTTTAISSPSATSASSTSSARSTRRAWTSGASR